MINALLIVMFLLLIANGVFMLAVAIDLHAGNSSNKGDSH